MQRPILDGMALRRQRAGDMLAYTGTGWAGATRIKEVLTAADLDAQSGTLTAAQILGGILVHTSVTGGGTLTTDTAASIIAGIPLTRDDQCIAMYYVNDGTQTVTLAGGASVTVADAGQTIATNESAILLFRRTSSTTVTVYSFD